jgi:hypothetical protein
MKDKTSIVLIVVERPEDFTVVVESGVVEKKGAVIVRVVLAAGIADIESVPFFPPGGLGGEALATELIEGRGGKSPRTTSDRLSTHAKSVVCKALMSKRS